MEAEVAAAEVESLQYEIYFRSKECGTMEVRLADMDFEGRPVSRVEVELHVKLKYFLLSVYSSHSNEEALIDASGTFRYTRNGKEGATSTKIAGTRENAEFRFEIEEKGRIREKAFKRADYDFTSMDEPDLQVQGREEKFRVLNLEKCRIEDHTVTWVRSEELLVGGEPVETRVIEFQTPEEFGTRWVTPDLGLLVKEEGKDRDGDYAVKLAQLAD